MTVVWYWRRRRCRAPTISWCCSIPNVVPTVCCRGTRSETFCGSRRQMRSSGAPSWCLVRQRRNAGTASSSTEHCGRGRTRTTANWTLRTVGYDPHDVHEVAPNCLLGTWRARLACSYDLLVSDHDRRSDVERVPRPLNPDVRRVPGRTAWRISRISTSTWHPPSSSITRGHLRSVDAQQPVRDARQEAPTG